MIRKRAQLEILATFAPVADNVLQLAQLSDFDFVPEPGMLYVATRAISSRVNANYDGWPVEELDKGWKTFLGKAVYVDHHNWDLKRSRGVILDAKFHEATLANGATDAWVGLLIEVDASAYPKLADAIITGKIDSVSMGADVGYTKCSACGNIAHDTSEYCEHIPYLKGYKVEVTDEKTGSIHHALVWEDCYDIGFFEISFVFDPADESAKFTRDNVLYIEAHKASSKRVTRKLDHPKEAVTQFANRTASFKRTASKRADVVEMALPEPVNTLREEVLCPVCGSEFDGMICENCGYEEPPEDLADPDTEPREELDDQREDRLDDEAQELVDDEKSPKIELEETDKTERRPVGGLVSKFEQLASRRVKADVGTDYNNDETMFDTDTAGESVVPPAEVPEQSTEDAATEPGTADVEVLDATDVVAPTGQSEVTVVGDEVDHAQEGSIARKRRAAYLKRKAQQKKADDVAKTDVENLDANPITEEALATPDDVQDVEAPVAVADQLDAADWANDVNDGSETGFSQDNPPDGTQVFDDATYDRGSGLSASAIASAQRTHLLNVIALVEDREALSLSDRSTRLAEVARLEGMSKREFIGYKKAHAEFKTAQHRTAGRRKVATVRSAAPQRLPQMGRLTSARSNPAPDAAEVDADLGVALL